MTTAKEIYEKAIECGFDNCGIISPEMLLGFDQRMQERLENTPESTLFYDRFKHFAHVKERFPWAKSIIVCTFEFGKYRFPATLQGKYAKAFLLKPEEGSTDGFDQYQFEKWLTDKGIRWETGDVPLRYAAVTAGLGIIRKNNFLYTENGSYVTLIGYVTDCDATLVHTPNLRPCSEKCDLCRRGCKTAALSAPYTMNPLKCVSFWTTFGKGNIPKDLSEDMFEEWVCGCDNCQDVCPFNRKQKWDEGEKFSEIEDIAHKMTPEALLEQTDDFIRLRIIPKTDRHLNPEDVPVLRANAQRALRFRARNQ